MYHIPIQVIESLLYIMLGTGPDVPYAVAALSQHAANPLKEHLDKALYICQYLLGTHRYSLVFDGASQAGLQTLILTGWIITMTITHTQAGSLN